MIVAPADFSHAADIASIHVRSWQAAYVDILSSEYLRNLSIADRTECWRTIFERNESRTLVATVENQVLGFVSYGDHRNGSASTEDGEIRALYIDPSVWRQGIGSFLMQRAIQELRALSKLRTSLWVFSQNLRGVSFYQSLGFVRLAESEKTFELAGSQVKEVRMLLRHDG